MTEIIPLDARDRRLAAERLALKILDALAKDERRLAEFFDETGLNPDTLRKVSRGLLFFLGILDWLLRDTERVGWFCELAEVSVAAVERAQKDLAPPRPRPEPVPEPTGQSRRPKLPPLPPRRLYR